MKMIDKLIIQLIKHEGLRLKGYRCSAGYLTIGVGHNIDSNPLTKYQCEYLNVPLDNTEEYLINIGISKSGAIKLLNDDIFKSESELDKAFEWFKYKPEFVKIVLIDMVFNLGLAGLKKFSNTINLIKNDRFVEASKEMLNSRWANQVGKRAINLSNILSGVELK